MFPIKHGLALCRYLASRLGLRMTPLGWNMATLVNSYVGLFVLIHSSAQHAAWKSSPRITYTMESRLLLLLDSNQRLLGDEVGRGLLRLLRFNYLFWRPAFGCRSSRLSAFLRRLFDFSLSWTKNHCMLGGKEQTKLNTLNQLQRQNKGTGLPI